MNLWNWKLWLWKLTISQHNSLFREHHNHNTIWFVKLWKLWNRCENTILVSEIYPDMKNFGKWKKSQFRKSHKLWTQFHNTTLDGTYICCCVRGKPSNWSIRRWSSTTSVRTWIFFSLIVRFKEINESRVSRIINWRTWNDTSG